MARAALESLPLTRKWTGKKKKKSRSHPPGPEEEKTRGGEDVKDKGWEKCKYMVTVIGREVCSQTTCLEMKRILCAALDKMALCLLLL